MNDIEERLRRDAEQFAAELADLKRVAATAELSAQKLGQEVRQKQRVLDYVRELHRLAAAGAEPAPAPAAAAAAELPKADPVEEARARTDRNVGPPVDRQECLPHKKPLNDAGLPLRRGTGRKVRIEGYDDETFAVSEAAQLLGCGDNSLRAALAPSGSGRIKRRVVWWDGEPMPTFDDAGASGAPAVSTPQPETGDPPPADSRPRGDGSAAPFNPNRIGAGAPVPQDPPRTRSAGWQPRTSEAV